MDFWGIHSVVLSPSSQFGFPSSPADARDNSGCVCYKTIGSDNLVWLLTLYPCHQISFTGAEKQDG